MSQSRIKIYFCTQCNWLLRASWISQEIINTFSKDIEYLQMVPSDGGKFEVWCNEKLIFSRKDEGGFIDVKFIKQRLRDGINPHMDLGHSDRKE